MLKLVNYNNCSEDLVRYTGADYLTYEFITKSREEHEAYLRSQVEALN